MNFRLQVQEAEVMGSDNRWYCAQAQGRKIDDPALLWIHFIKSGGAADFAIRFDEAMGAKNKWYCSEYYDRSITDPAILWEYYGRFCRPGFREEDIAEPPQPAPTELVLVLD